MLNVSRHGIVTTLVMGEAVVDDCGAVYVDDLVDCFESFTGEGSLKEHCVKLFRKEYTFLRSAGIAGLSPIDELFENHLAMRTKLCCEIEAEGEDRLVALRIEWLKAPAKLIKREVKLAHKRLGFITTGCNIV